MTSQNLQHPTYKAFAELGKAIKTIFLCQYLHSEALRREIHDGVNVCKTGNYLRMTGRYLRMAELSL